MDWKYDWDSDMNTYINCQTVQKNTSWSSLFILNNNTYSTVKALPENKEFYTFRNQFKYLSQIRRMKGKICRCQLCKEKIKVDFVNYDARVC